MSYSRFAPWLERWRLDPDGEPFETATSHLLPVLAGAEPAMLKLLKPASDEAPGILALAWFAGEGAVRLLGRADDALLMERATGGRSLSAMAVGGADMAAADILADTAVHLYGHADAPFPAGIPTLQRRFRALFERRGDHRLFGAAASVAERLLAEPRRVVVLHGDIHHQNVLESPRGWLAIDPKGVVGEATYDVANLFLNPLDTPSLTLDPTRALQLADLLSGRLGVERQRILAFAFAHAGLSTAWLIEDGHDPAAGFRIAEMLAGLQSSPGNSGAPSQSS